LQTQDRENTTKSTIEHPQEQINLANSWSYKRILSLSTLDHTRRFLPYQLFDQQEKRKYWNTPAKNNNERIYQKLTAEATQGSFSTSYGLKSLKLF